MMLRKSPIFLLVPGMMLAAAMLSCSQVANLPNPFASATPTATATFTQTVTPSPTPTSTPTMTPTPRPTGVDADRQADSRTVVRDFDNNYEFILPKEWTAIPLTKEDIDRIVQQMAEQDPEFAKLAESMRTADDNVLRLLGFNTDPKYVKAQNPTLFMLIAIPDKIVGSLPMAGVTAIIEDNTFTGSSDTTWDVVNNPHGVEVGVVQGTYKFVTPEGKTLKTKSKVIAFQANQKLIMIQFITPVQFGAEVLPGVDQIIDTIQLMTP